VFFTFENKIIYPSEVSNLINHVFLKKMINHAFREACSLLLPYKYNAGGTRIYDIISTSAKGKQAVSLIHCRCYAVYAPASFRRTFTIDRAPVVFLFALCHASTDRWTCLRVSPMLNVQRGYKLGPIGCAMADENSHNACARAMP
jgi:hypothetical protein